MNDIERKRLAVSTAYPGPTWARKVQRMTEQQVVAVYLRLKKQGKVV